MRARLLALPLMLALIGASCAPQSDTSASADKHAVEIGPAAAAIPPPPPSIQPPPANPANAPPQTSPVLVVPLSKPGHAGAAPKTKNPSAHTVDTNCRTSADCAVKNVGNCCGQYPACVNKDSPTFPNEVRAQCSKQHSMGVCGFPSISGCECVHGKCSDITGMSNAGSVR